MKKVETKQFKQLSSTELNKVQGGTRVALEINGQIVVIDIK